MAENSQQKLARSDYACWLSSTLRNRA